MTGTTTATTFSGTLSFAGNNANGVPGCFGQIAAAGNAGGTTFTWTSPGVAGANCTNMPTNLTFAMQVR